MLRRESRLRAGAARIILEGTTAGGSAVKIINTIRFRR
jgi:hypothetical protein